METKTNTLLDAASNCLAEAQAKKAPASDANGCEALTDKENNDILKILRKYISPSKVKWAAESIFDEISKNIWSYPNYGNISVNEGSTNVKESPTELSVSHNGNTGNTLKNVDQNLKSLKYPTIDELKKKFPKFKESGSPDHSYEITFKKPANSEFIGRHYL